MGPESASAGRHPLEMASSEAKDSSLVHFISLRGFCVLVLAPSTTCSTGLGFGHSMQGAPGWGRGERREWLIGTASTALTLRERLQVAKNERVVKCVCESRGRRLKGCLLTFKATHAWTGAENTPGSL